MKEINPWLVAPLITPSRLTVFILRKLEGFAVKTNGHLLCREITTITISSITTNTITIRGGQPASGHGEVTE